jgi:hypothetical protein
MKHHISTRLGAVALILTATVAAVATALPSISTATASAYAAPAVRAAGSHVGGTANLRLPHANLAASPDFHTQCATDGTRNDACMTEALAAINRAHAAEGVRKMILPSNYKQLSLAQQTFVVTNLERVDRGMRPIVGLTARLNQSARHAALVRDDPTLIGSILNLLGVREYSSIWAGDFGPLASDYDWMYNDGYSANGSINMDCKQPGDSGCWGHRKAILGRFTGMPTLIAGSATGSHTGFSLAEIIVGATVGVPALTFSWQDALAYGANGHKVAA